MERSRYIVVDGPIGAGKTTLARILADEFHARLLLEGAEENPFLAKFYQEPRKYAFATQLFFLLSRFRQQREAAQLDLFAQNTVADYLFAKDWIFAQVNLEADELAIYQQLYDLLRGQIPQPDLVVYLQAPVEVLLYRLRKRGRPYEEWIASQYLQRVAEAYRHFFHRYDDTPLLVVNSSEKDFLEHGGHVADLLKEIREMRQGVQHYIPLASS